MWRVMFSYLDRFGMSMYPGSSYTEEQARASVLARYPQAIIKSVTWVSM